MSTRLDTEPASVTSPEVAQATSACRTEAGCCTTAASRPGAKSDTGRARRRGLDREGGHVPAGRFPEQPAALPADLGLTLVPDPERRLAGVETFSRHQTPRHLEPKPLLV